MPVTTCCYRCEFSHRESNKVTLYSNLPLSSILRIQLELLKRDEHKLLTLDGYDLYVRDLKTLSGASWLNDKVSV